MSDEVILREAQAGDAAAIADLVVALNTHIGWAQCSFTSESFARDGLGPDRWFDTLVAEASGRLVGYAMFHRSYDTENAQRGTYLTDLYVSPEARGRGTGYGLLSAVAARTVEWGGDVVWWVTTQDNQQGKAFYQRLAKTVENVEIWVAAEGDFHSLLASR